MFKKLTLSAIAAVGLMAGATNAAVIQSEIEDFDFSFEGPFGTYDENQLQRGLKVYTNVCASCHGLKYVPIRTLADEGGVGLPVDQVRAYAAQFDIYDPELDDWRPGKPTDSFPESNDPNAPDLSLMAKARAGFSGPYGSGLNQLFKGMGGAEYIASILTGYTGEEKEEAGSILYQNTAFPGGWISMAPPLWGEDVDFDDGSSNALRDEAVDTAAFLMWAAEPKMMGRKETGFIAVLFLVLMSVLLYATNKRIWAPIKRQAKES